MPGRLLCLISALLAIACSTRADAQALNEIQMLTPESRSGGDRFGHTVASNDRFIAVSAPGQPLGNAVYIFDAATGDQTYKLEAADSVPGEFFGMSLSMNQTQLAVINSVLQGPDRVLSSVDIVDLQTGERASRFQLDNIMVSSWVGFIALSNSVLAIGAPWDSDAGEYSGAVYLYDTMTGELVRKIYPTDPREFGLERFGSRLDVHEDTLAVFAAGGSGAELNPVVNLIDINTGDALYVIASDDDPFSTFAPETCAFNNEYVAMGSHEDRTIRLYDRTTGSLVAQLQTEDGYVDSGFPGTDSFGYEIKMDDDYMLVSAQTDSLNGHWAGAAYLFDLSTGSQLAKLLPTESTYGGEFGFSISLSNGRIGIGEPYNRDQGRDTGAAYLFDASSAHRCSPDFDDNGQLNITDINLFIGHYSAGHPSADFDVDGLFNFYDVSEFIHEFTTGCP